MTITIEADFAGIKQNLTIRPGQCAIVGSSCWADLPVENDNNLASEHFCVDHSTTPEVRSLESSSVIVEGAAAKHIAIDQDLVFSAGETTFQVKLHSTAVKHANAVAGVLDDVPKAEITCIDREFATQLRLSSDAIDRLAGCSQLTVAEILSQYSEAKSQTDCIRLLGLALQPVRAVALLQLLLSKTGNELTERALELVGSWLASPNEDSRLPVAAELTMLDAERPQYWLLQAIAWSGGSLGPSDTEDVPPPAHLFPLALSIAHHIAKATAAENLALNADAFQSTIDAFVAPEESDQQIRFTEQQAGAEVEPLATG